MIFGLDIDNKINRKRDIILGSNLTGLKIGQNLAMAFKKIIF
jgi:hypothetical protein